MRHCSFERRYPLCSTRRARRHCRARVVDSAPLSAPPSPEELCHGDSDLQSHVCLSIQNSMAARHSCAGRVPRPAASPPAAPTGYAQGVGPGGAAAARAWSSRLRHPARAYISPFPRPRAGAPGDRCRPRPLPASSTNPRPCVRRDHAADRCPLAPQPRLTAPGWWRRPNVGRTRAQPGLDARRCARHPSAPARR